MSKVIWTGLEDSGKSYMLAVVSTKIAYRNAEWLKITGRPRPIVSNLPYSDEFKNLCRSLKVPLRNWKDLEELPELEEGGGDLFIDEVGTYFDSRTYKDLPLHIRLWLAQASKLGWDIYGAAQDFSQVDIAFRRLTNTLYYVKKLMGSSRPALTKPPVRFIWGICTVKEMDPIGYDEKMAAFNQVGWFPWPFFIRKDFCQIFDTTKRIPKSAPPPFRHVARRCEVEGCKFELFQIDHGTKHKIQHV